MAKSGEDDPRVGTILDGSWRLLSVLGRGGLATVYRGEPVDGGPHAAVKLLTSLTSASPKEGAKQLRRFNREALAISQLKHPNTVRLLDFGVGEDGIPYMVLELVDGESLHQRIEARERVAPEQLARVLHHVCLALAEAHGHDLVHRDIKPANIMLARAEDGRRVVKVVDFGAVRLKRQIHRRMTELGATLGSAPYMSPEQAQAEELTGASDLYSVGVSAYEALTGELPFTGSFSELMSQHLFAEPPRLALDDLSKGRLAGWQALLDRLLAKDPAARPTATEAAAAFAALAEPERGGRAVWLAAAVVALAAAGVALALL